MAQLNNEQVSNTSLKREGHYPLGPGHNPAHAVADQAHYIIPHVIHLQELLEPGDQQSHVLFLWKKPTDHSLHTEKNDTRQSYRNGIHTLQLVG